MVSSNEMETSQPCTRNGGAGPRTSRGSTYVLDVTGCPPGISAPPAPARQKAFNGLLRRFGAAGI